jgi:hypothetical protein
LPKEERRTFLNSLSFNERATVLEAMKRVDSQDVTDSARYARFRETYRDDPVAFLFDCVRWEDVRNSNGPAGYQLEILGELPRKRRVSARGPHGLGKTAIESWAVLWFSLVSDGEDWKAITTASAWRQLTIYLWPEIHKWSRHLKWETIGRKPFVDGKELLDRNIKLETGQASSVASSDHGKIEGAHADRLLFAYDEAKIIPDATWDASEGAFSTGECYGLAVSTPGPPIGRFFDIHSRKPGYEEWWVRHVTVDEAMRAGRISEDWVEARRKQWGEDSPLFRNRVLGEFAEEGTDGVIPLSWVEAANERWLAWEDAGKIGLPVTLGVDVGEQGDHTVLAPRFEANVDVKTDVGDGKVETVTIGYAIDILEVYPKLDTMQTVAKVRAFLERWRQAAPRCTAIVDSIGIGSGVVSRLRELKRKVVAWAASGKSTKKDEAGIHEFLNKRAEGWWGLRELLDPSTGSTLALPPDDDLLGEIVSPTYRETSGGKIVIEKKAEVKKRLGRSTDRADAVMMALNGRPGKVDKKQSVQRRRYGERKSVWRGR